MNTNYFPALTAKVHMAMVNAGAASLSTAEVADRAGVPVGDGGFARSLIWRELDMLARRGLVERIRQPESRFVRWRRVPAPAGPGQCPHTPACPPIDAADAQRARIAVDYPSQGWSRLCNGLILVDHEPLEDPFIPAVPRLTRRIQRRRTAGWRMPEGALYVGRPSRWGNPFPVAQHSAAGAVANYRLWLESQPELVAAALIELAGRDLACWCPLSQPCHADVLLQIARSAGPTTPGAER